MQKVAGNTLKLGIKEGFTDPLIMTPDMRAEHLYICGATGTGKSKMLEYLIRQDIKQWHNSKCGALILDPHGSLYTSLINWIAWHAPYLGDVPIVPIDLRQRDWTIGYNVLRPRREAATSVVIGNFIDAVAHVWGADGIDRTPLFARVAKEVLWPLCERKLTLLEAQFLIDSHDKRTRMELTNGLSNLISRRAWLANNDLRRNDFSTQFQSTSNRLSPFFENEHLSLIFGQDAASLDLFRAMEEGQIIIVNLSTQGGKMSKRDVSLFGTVLLNDLWTSATERGKLAQTDKMKPFYVYIDEFQKFVSPTIGENLDEARGFGLHLTLANQYPRQILHASARGAQVYDSVMVNARTKLVFSLEGEEHLRPLAQSLFMGVMDPDEIKLTLYSRKVKDYVEETRTIHSEGESWSEGVGDFTGSTDTTSSGGAVHDGTEHDAHLWNQSNAASGGTSSTSLSGGSRGKTTVPFLRPVWGQEVSSVQYRSLEEQLFQAMAVLFDQMQRHCVVRLVENRIPIKLATPIVEQMPTPKEITDSFLESAYQKLPFAIRGDEAAKQIKQRQDMLLSGGLSAEDNEPDTARRKIS